MAYVLQDMPKQLFDPALGEGVFFHAAKQHAKKQGFDLALYGCDIDSKMILKAKRSGLKDSDLQNVDILDFVLDFRSRTFPAIVANPPYIRHHRLSPTQKACMRDFARQSAGLQIDGRAGLHVYFLIKALLTLSPGGRLAYIVSADICEGVFAKALWQWVSSHYRIDAIVAFAPDATPFPGVDTNALIFCIQNRTPTTQFSWIRCLSRNPDNLIALLCGKDCKIFDNIEVYSRTITEALETGLSRSPSLNKDNQFSLRDFATVMRGIVTGDNDFFFMTAARAKMLGIPDSMLVKALGRTRDVQGDRFGPEDIARLEHCGRPTRLLDVNGLPFDKLPEAVQRYLKEGASRGLPEKTLIKTRKPWYRMEKRKIPPILFAYLGRRKARFICNHADVVPLTCLLCVYPRRENPQFVNRLWNVLSHPETIQNLRLVGKSYGGDAIKVEPRALERLPLPEHLVYEQGLDKYVEPKQMTLFA